MLINVIIITNGSSGVMLGTRNSQVPRSVAAGHLAGGRPGSVAGDLHDVQEGLGLAKGRRGRVDVDAVGVGGLGGGGHLAGGAVGGGDFGVGDDGRVGGLRLGAGVAVEKVELGDVGRVDLVLDDDHVTSGRGGAGDV